MELVWFVVWPVAECLPIKNYVRTGCHMAGSKRIVFYVVEFRDEDMGEGAVGNGATLCPCEHLFEFIREVLGFELAVELRFFLQLRNVTPGKPTENTRYILALD